MWTTMLAYLILFMGFITFLGGAFGALMLIFEEVAKTGRVPFIPNPIDQNPWAHWRSPMDMMRQG